MEFSSRETITFFVKNMECFYEFLGHLEKRFWAPSLSLTQTQM